MSTQRLGEARDSLVNLLRRSSCEGRAEEHLLLDRVVVRLEPAAAGEEDASVHSGQEDLFFNIGMCLTSGNTGVLAPVN